MNLYCHFIPSLTCSGTSLACCEVITFHYLNTHKTIPHHRHVSRTILIEFSQPEISANHSVDERIILRLSEKKLVAKLEEEG